MRTLLISCYELGHQPLGLASPAAHLLAAGVEVGCLDLAVEPWDEPRVRAADFVGISVPMHTAIRLGYRVGQKVRAANPHCHVCYYGLYASLNADYLLATVADSIVGGEYETPLVELVLGLAGAENGNGPGGVSLAGRPGGLPFLGRQRFLAPARHLLPPLERYTRLQVGDGISRLVGSAQASRGCAHHCRHCPIPAVFEGRLRIVQEEVALQDIRAMVRMGAEHISFADPDFLNGVRHSLRVVHRMADEFPGLSFDFTAKIEHLIEHSGLLPELASLGCLFITSAVESVDDTILGYLNKGHTAADVFTALQITRNAGVFLRPTLLAFTPWTTLEGYLALLEFVEANDLVENVDPVQYSIRLLLPPGSLLLELPELRPHLRDLEPESFAYRWAHPDDRMDQLQREVAGLAQNAAAAGEDVHVTFHRIKEAAYATLGGRSPVEFRMPGLSSSRAVPRLTESWFCCAEPTDLQLDSL